jgi:hypothetical protein
MKVRERWRSGLRLEKAAALNIHNAHVRAQEEGQARFARKLHAILRPTSTTLVR